MRFALVCVFFLSGNLFAGEFDELDFLVTSTRNCPVQLIYGSLPTDRREEQYNPFNVVSTEILNDSAHIRRLHLAHLDSATNKLVHVRNLADLGLKGISTTPKSLLVNGLDSDPETTAAYYGAALHAKAQADKDNARASCHALATLNHVFNRLSASLLYLKTWRHHWLQMENQTGNETYLSWLESLEKEWKVNLETEHAKRLAPISQATETALKHRKSSLFRRTPLATPAVTLENWDTQFPQTRLPEVAKRAVDYLKANLQAIPLIENPQFQALLAFTAETVRDLDSQLSTP